MVDDYYEDAALERCTAEGIEPGTLVPSMRRGDTIDRAARTEERSLGAPFYTSGGPTTHWGGSGIDPWTDAGIENKRARLLSHGMTADNWMWKLALTARQWESSVLRAERNSRFNDLTSTGEASSGFVWFGQYGQDPRKPLEGEQVKQGKTLREVGKTPFKTPTYESVDESQDTDGQRQQLDVQRESVAPPTTTTTTTPRVAASPIGGEGQREQQRAENDAGRVIVESQKETLKRKREAAKTFEPGRSFGVYEVSSDHHVSLSRPCH